jgi:hypothetical protein
METHTSVEKEGARLQATRRAKVRESPAPPQPETEAPQQMFGSFNSSRRHVVVGKQVRLDLAGHGVDVGGSVHARVGGDGRDLVEVR